MSTDLDPRLRAALNDLADVPPPAVSTAAVLTGARHRRRRTAGLVAAAAVLAAAAVTAPFLVLGKPAPTEPAAAAPHAALTGYVTWDSYRTGLWEYRTYDPSTGRYVKTPWHSAVPSPDGRRVVVTKWDEHKLESVGIVAADRVLDPAAVRWIARPPRPLAYPPFEGPGVWSPDGSRILFGNYVSTGPVRQNELHMVVVDSRTLERRPVTFTRPLSGPVASLPGPPSVVFGPRGEGFASVAGTTLTLFDEQGRAIRTLPVESSVLSDRPFSPDGRLVALHDPNSTAGSTTVLSLDSGAVVGRADADAVAWLDDRHYVVRRTASVEVVELASGRPVAERKLATQGHPVVWAYLGTPGQTGPPGVIVL